MQHQMTTLQLLVGTYGEAFDPATRPPIHVMATGLPNGAAIQEALKQCAQTWRSSDTSDIGVLLGEAIGAIGPAIKEGNPGSGSWSLLDDPAAWRPVLDKNGNIIGHDTVAWLLNNGSPVKTELRDGQNRVKLGFVACVLISVREL